MFSRPYVTNTYLTVMLPSDKIKKTVANLWQFSDMGQSRELFNPRSIHTLKYLVGII